VSELAFILQVVNKLEQQTIRTQAQFLFVFAAKFEKFKTPLDYLLSCTIFFAAPTTSSQPFRELFANLAGK